MRRQRKRRRKMRRQRKRRRKRKDRLKKCKRDGSRENRDGGVRRKTEQSDEVQGRGRRGREGGSRV